MKTLVLIPTYNEKDNIPILIADLMAIPDVHVMVLDDQSPDGTGQVADELGVKCWPRPGAAPHRPRGLGVSYLGGFPSRHRKRRRLRVPDGCRPLARSEILAERDRSAMAGADLVIGPRT